MSTEMNATETVQGARGRKPCPGHKQFKGAGWPTLPCDGWVNPEINELCRTLPDPLADTPEGDHEFMAILRWAQGRFGETIIEWVGGKWRVRIAHPDSGFMWYSGESGNEKEARLEALAAAIKGETASGRAAQEGEK